MTTPKTIKEFVKGIKTALGAGPRETNVYSDDWLPGSPIKHMVWVQYHDTDVVKLYTDAEFRPVIIVLDTGTWRTVTTRKRMNDVLRLFFAGGVFQEKHEMFFGFPGFTAVPFEDGLEIHFFKNGNVKRIVNGNGGPSIYRVKPVKRAK